MSNTSEIGRLLNLGKSVYMLYPIDEIALRINPQGINYIKHKGKEEHEVPRSYDVAVEIKLGGEFCTQEEYEAY